MHLDIKQIVLLPHEFDLYMQSRQETLRSSEIIPLYEDWKKLKHESDQVSADLNQLAKDFKPEFRESITNLKQKSKDLESRLDEKRKELDYRLDRVPNWLDPAVPVGKNSEDNVVIGEYNSKPTIENPKHHEVIAHELGLMCREEAVAMSGSRFMILKGDLAKLERILVQFALDHNARAGYLEMSVPFMVLENSLYNTGQLPKFRDDYFAFDGMALIPTGEVPLINYCAGKHFTISDLPLKLTTHTPCFRKEAGSLGKDTKGLTRLHQFHKIELVAVTTTENSSEMHMSMLKHTQKFLDLLELHYRIVEVCSGDIGFTAARQFDLEVWMPGQAKYVEVASCSNCHDFQARRMNTKYTDSQGQKHFVHTLNSTGIACGRIIAAILETYCINGKFILPNILYEYWKS